MTNGLVLTILCGMPLTHVFHGNHMGISLCLGQFDVYMYMFIIKITRGKNMCDYKLSVVYRGYVKIFYCACTF
jgi:hypothetical protein